MLPSASDSGPEKSVSYADASGRGRMRWQSRCQASHRRSEVRSRVVPELDDLRMPLEGGLHTGALHAPPASMDEAYFAQSGGGRTVQILTDDGRNVGGGEAVGGDLGFDGEGRHS